MKMKNKLLRILSGIGIVVIILLIPFFLKDKNHLSLSGPDLSEIKYSEITYNNNIQNLKLSGMLILPEGNGPFPVAILIHGSGPSRRNSVWYLSVSKHLQKNGIAVLLPDKRGCEKSQGKWIGANFNDLSSDVISSIDFIKTQNLFSGSKIGIIGMSQGGWIAPIVATRSKDVSFIVSMSGATVSTDEQLLYEEINNIAPYTYTFIARLLAPITASNLKKKDFFAPIAGFDPILFWKKVDVPAFFAYGENDKNVPVEECINRLKENDLNYFIVKIYPEGGHAIEDVNTKKVSTEFLNDLVGFIKGISN
jgi:uncharacterized protein